MKYTLLTLLVFIGLDQSSNQIEPVSPPNEPYEAYRYYYTKSKDLFDTDPEQGLLFADTALAFAYRVDSVRVIAKAQFLVGKNAKELQHYALAYEMFTLAKEGYAHLGDEEYVGWCYNNLAAIHTMAGHYEEAKELHLLALGELQGKVSKSDLALLQRDIANITMQEGNFELAITQYNAALAIAPDDPKNLANSYMNLGYCHKCIRDHAGAEQQYYNAYQASTAASSYVDFGRIANQLACYALDANEAAQALVYAKEGIKALEDKWHPFSLENNLINQQARSYFRLGEPEKAYEVLTQLLQKPECASADEAIIETYNLLIEEYLMPSGSAEVLAQARAERKAHQERIGEESRDKREIAAADIFAAETKMAGKAKDERIAFFEKYGTAMVVGGVLVFIGLFVVLGWQLRRRIQRKESRQRVELEAARSADQQRYAQALQKIEEENTQLHAEKEAAEQRAREIAQAQADDLARRNAAYTKYIEPNKGLI